MTDILTRLRAAERANGEMTLLLQDARAEIEIRDQALTLARVPQDSAWQAAPSTPAAAEKPLAVLVCKPQPRREVRVMEWGDEIWVDAP